VEILKQDQFKPLPVELQVVVLFAVTRGYLDSVPVDKIKKIEEEIILSFQGEHKDLALQIKNLRDLTNELTNLLDSALKQIVQKFLASNV
jgi:F-type H+-transporting ATPase subunit alpha